MRLTLRENVSLVPGTRCEFVFNRLLFVLLLLPLATAAQDTLVIRLLEDSLQRERNDSLRIKYLNDISWQYHSSDIERAISYADRAGVLAHKSGNQWGIAKSYILHGVYFTIQGNTIPPSPTMNDVWHCAGRSGIPQG